MEVVVPVKTPSFRGALLVFEGPDRSGKSTQSKLLVQKLRNSNIPVEYMRFPDRSATNEHGERISRYLAKEIKLDNEEAHIIFTKQRLHEKERMEEMLSKGTTLVVDRYAHSGVAYSVAKGMDIHWCCQQETGLLEPDLVIYMNIPPEVAAKRGGFGKELFETAEFQRKVCTAYNFLRQKSWKVIDATKPVEEIINEIFENASKIVASCRTKPLRHLWVENLPERIPSFTHKCLEIDLQKL